MSFIQKYKWLMPMCIFIAAMLIVRVIYSGSFMFLFIPWNLFLVVVPLFFSYRIRQRSSKIAVSLYLAGWLLFFPNAMYIVTDLFHLHERPGVPLWYDLLILFSSALLGVIMGFLSLRNVERYLYRHIKRQFMPFLLFSCFILCGYGIYLGRYLRWNSWDIVTQPILLLSDIKQNVVHPFRNIECWLLTLLFGIWLCLLYKYFKKLRPEMR